MKWIGLVGFLLLFQLGFAQSPLEIRLNFTVRFLNPNQALTSLSQKSGVQISWSDNFFREDVLLALEYENETVEHILQGILEGFDVDYKATNRRIILFRKKPQTFTLAGYVQDAETGERLISATVFCTTTQTGTYTNEYGFFSLTLPEGLHELRTSYVGYVRQLQKIELNQNLETQIGLLAASPLEDVIIYSQDKPEKMVSLDENRALILQKDLVKNNPGLGGEEDYVRAAQMLPGISGGVDGLGGMNVRGGNAGQNLMLLDGATIYIPYHQLGIFSLYNPRTVQSVKLLKGSFPARYGGRTASVMDVRTRDGNQYQWHAEGGANLVNASLLLEGPLLGKKGSVILSGRTSHTNFLLSPVFLRTYFQASGAELHSRFHDLTGKLNYTFSPKDRLYLSFFTGSDHFEKEDEQESVQGGEEDELKFSWWNSTGALRWNHLFNEKLFANTSITYSSYGYDYATLTKFYSPANPDPEETYFLDNQSANRDLSLKSDFDFMARPGHLLKFGGGVSTRRFSPDLTYLADSSQQLTQLDTGQISTLQNLIQSPVYQAAEAYIYGEEQFDLDSVLQINAGLRASYFFNDDSPLFNLEPRLLARVNLNPRWQIFASGCRMVQYLHLVSNVAMPLPNDLWVPSADDIHPETSWQGEGGINWQATSQWEFSATGYFRQMSHLYAYPDSFSFLQVVNNDEPLEYLSEGNGRAWGVELMAHFTGKQNGGWVSYVYSRSDRQFADQNLGLRFPYEYDLRHQVRLFAFQQIGHNLQLGLNWVYNSPAPRQSLALIQSGIGLNAVEINPPGQKNQLRATPYHRLDLSASWNFQVGKSQHRLKAGVYNAYNRQNVAWYGPGPGSTNQSPIPAFPLRPNFGWEVRF
ncbi:MAG: carboxypeptidase-like regulatory domain-containing protein [Bacteroidia bacterium]|nr:carboxypeptidase-like regulatory domain-containing protein [Bacteroidia bacterium]